MYFCVSAATTPYMEQPWGHMPPTPSYGAALGYMPPHPMYAATLGPYALITMPLDIEDLG